MRFISVLILIAPMDCVVEVCMRERPGLKISKDADVLYFHIARAEAMNALNSELVASLSEELETAKTDTTLRALVITGEGELAFCGGADLKERRDMTLEQTMEFVRALGNTFQKLESLEIPAIAAINGFAFGGGLELALACDFRVAIADARMGLTECRLGIIPGAGGTQRLPKLIGAARAKKMILTAEIVDGKKAQKMGLVEEVASDITSLSKKVGQLVDSIKGCAPLSVKAAKWAINQGSNLKAEQGLMMELKAYESLLATKDRREGLEAFAQKRVPNYLGC